MSRLKGEGDIFSVDVDTTREHLLQYVQQGSHIKVIYFDGWYGFGTSSVLRSMAAVLPSRRTTPELCFDRIIYLDCSEWKSRRAMQRTVVEELKLDSSVMAILDKQDEEDDFNGVVQGSRDVIQSVAAVIDSTLTSTRFMMIFLNGSDDELDVTIFGIPQFTEFRNNIMMWTFKRRCLTINRHISEIKSKLRYTHFVTYCYRGMKALTNAQFEAILIEEANIIVYQNPCMLDIDPTMVVKCCLYELFLHYDFHNTNKSYWAGHASNYWICDGIIQGDKTRDITNAFHREISWTCDASLLGDFLKKFMKHLEPPFLAIKDDDVYKEGPYRWISVTSSNTELHGMQTIPVTTSSFFLAFKTPGHVPTLPDGLFEHSIKLGVLVLSCCAFNFASPPFLKCHSLRFLGLDHCIDDKKIEGDDHTRWLCLYNLWVLDLRHTDWNEILSQEKMDLMINIRELYLEGVRGWQYTADLRGRLPNLQSLRIIKPTCRWETSEDVDNSFTDKAIMETLDFSGNSDMENLPRSLSKASGLQLLILDGCDRLENVDVPGRLPAALKSFSFDGYGSASPRTRTPTNELPPKHFRPSTAENEKDIRASKISLEGCIELENLFLRGLPNLLELDLSGTAIKILDFKTMVVQVPRLKRLFLIGCKHLRAITSLCEGDSRIHPGLELLCIDTRAGIVCPRPSINKTKSFRLQVHAIVVDARFSYSLWQVMYPWWDNIDDVYYNIHVTSSPAVYDELVEFEETNGEKFVHCDQGCLQQLIPAGQYRDVLSMVHNPLMQAFPQAPAARLDRHIEIAEGSCNVESGLGANGALGQLMTRAKSLHLHDVSIHAIFPTVIFYWMHLRWCHVERCPKLDTVFPSHAYEFSTLETFWASDLLMARWIWRKGLRNEISYFEGQSFQKLQHLHLCSCPSLQFVIPVWVSSFPSLETLHIIHCGNLLHVFELEHEEMFSLGMQFPKLTTIHLHDLPKLRQICKVKMMTPMLENIKIRGCWGLQRLPCVTAPIPGAKKPVVEIEKDVWDALEWDADHRPDHFEAPVHSRYYKKKLPKVSFLR
uniref:Uncharacterized protein n=1 Tax=Avena sativa TaxID=4498 RepID=A0ACD5TSB3_AVESA